MRYYLKIKSGFTLIEVLVTMAIMLIVMGFIYGVFFSESYLWEVNRLSAEIQAEGRTAMSIMVTELRNATRTSSENPSPNLSIPSVPNNKHLSFYLPYDDDDDGLITDANGEIEWDTSNKIEYQYIPGQNHLRRLEKGNHRILARSVTDVQFIDVSIDTSLYLDEVKIIFSITRATAHQRSVSMTFTARVKLRN